MPRPNQRPSQRRSEEHRVGRRIRAREVRVIDSDGQQRGIMSVVEAIGLAEQAGLDLVEINAKSNPPVCKVMDYGRFKYERSKQERDAKKNQKNVEVKEVKFRPKTGDHDYDFKMRHVRRFLEDGDKIKVLVQFRGREIVHPDVGKAVLDRVCKDLADIATVAQMASMEGRRMTMVLAPKKGAIKPKPKAADAGGKAGAVAPRPTDDDLPPLEDLDDDDDDDDDDLDDDVEAGASGDVADA